MSENSWHDVMEFRGVEVGPDEGWFMYLRKEIQVNPGNHPNPHRFRNNEDAIAFVRRRAEEGSAFHQAALVQHIKARLLK